MSQDNTSCVICNKKSGYDDGAGYWDGKEKSSDLHSNICSICLSNLISRFTAFFGLDGASWEHSGLSIEWHEVHKILSNIKRDYAMRVSYITTDKEMYERTERVQVPILEQGGK